MMKRIFMAIVAMAVLQAAVLQGSVWAGDNGGKTDSTIRITNTDNFLAAGVAVNREIQAATPEEFVARGGVILQPGESRNFNVRAGNNRVQAVFLPNGPVSSVSRFDIPRRETVQIDVFFDGMEARARRR